MANNALPMYRSKNMAEKRVGALVVSNPSYAPILEEFGIDYCCRGKMSLTEACELKGLDVNTVCERLLIVEPVKEEEDLSRFSIQGLINNIVSVHHDYLKAELPRIDFLIRKVVKAHGEMHLELMDVLNIFTLLKQELEMHLEEEETKAFPLYRAIEEGSEGDKRSLQDDIHTLQDDHEKVGQLLAELHRLTGGYKPPKNACTTYRVMLHSLDKLEKDIHVHVHKENAILFPLVTSLVKS